VMQRRKRTFVQAAAKNQCRMTEKRTNPTFVFRRRMGTTALLSRTAPHYTFCNAAKQAALRAPAAKSGVETTAVRSCGTFAEREVSARYRILSIRLVAATRRLKQPFIARAAKPELDAADANMPDTERREDCRARPSFEGAFALRGARVSLTKKNAYVLVKEHERMAELKTQPSAVRRVGLAVCCAPRPVTRYARRMTR